MRTSPSLHQSSRSSTGALSQQATLLATAASTQCSSPNNSSSLSSSTPNSTSTPTAANAGAFENAISKRQLAQANSVFPASIPSLSSVPQKCPSSKVARAIREFKNRLLGNEVLDFKNTTVEDLRREMRRIQLEQEGRRDLVNMRRIQGCIEAMDSFGKVIEVFLNVSEAVAFIWGPMKFLLITASTVLESFETLLDAYEQIGDQMPLLKSYESLFSDDDLLKGALELMYVDILNFHEKAVPFFRGRVWKHFFRSMWNDFSTKFGGILKSLGRHKNFVDNCAQRAQYQLYQHDIADMKATSLVRYQQYEQDAQGMNARLDELVAEERVKRTKAVIQWLAASQQPIQDHEIYCQIRAEFPRTAHWILKRAYINDWIERTVPSTPLLWLHGIPGAGKTILASAIIDKCKAQPDFATAFYYCHSDDQTNSSAVGILKGITQQLLDHDAGLLPPCYRRYKSSGEPVLRSLSQAISLLKDLCTILPKVYIVLDGLDECEQVERKQAMDALMHILDECEKSDPGKFRVLFISQNFADIKRVLYCSSQSRPAPQTIQLSHTDNEDDINAYVGTWVSQIAAKYEPFNDDMVEYLRNLTVRNAKGMFLYARLVMENLYAQPTREDLMEGIRQDNFPQGLKGAYERILRHMKHISSDGEWDKAKKLLGWMICAKRRLTWKEIQVALSIDLDAETIEYDGRHLRTHIHDICGSLVLLNGDRVSLVHSTARTYITTVHADIHEPSIECELATLCLRYLTFPCFDIEAVDDQQELKQLALDGHFAFQDYAIAKWYYHVNAFVNSGARFMSEAVDPDSHLEGMMEALEDFTERFSDANWGQNIVQDCRANCTAFANLPVHDKLVELTSHIYTVQKKGFDARHEVSIKSLAEALERNRKILEELPSSPRFSQNDLDKYSRFYDHERRFKCSKITCRYFSEGFRDLGARNKHLHFHTRPFHCDVPDCLGSEGFVNHGDLQRHMRAFHPEMSDLAETFNSISKPPAKSDHACAICGKTFTRSFARRNHENSHRGVRPFPCPECGKAFTRRNDLVRHQKLHERT
ncbi:C2H2 domain-containing protein [Boeremia exigua]|uniref:C2H2 domain-containing protein n=1 Tax=Boeremia exigua TaxID=749465 RepID=UPI001E8CB27C|nr:C2H2 domain-containing protein [Boeremia exigua]KAH6622333.1 C2H2 domain-containing protein [Boeremia exigua]